MAQLTNGTHINGEVQSPPHADEMEQHVMTELSQLLQKQTALAAQRMSEQTRVQKELTAHLDKTATKADVALRLFTQTLVEIRQYNEEGTQLLKRLVEAHEDLGLLVKRQ
jgi:hypothetical protein